MQPELRAGLFDRAFFNGHLQLLQSGENLLSGETRQKAKVSGARRGHTSLGCKLAPGLMEVDLLLTEMKSMAAISKLFVVHAKHHGIKNDRSFQITDCEHEVIETS